MDDIGTFIWSVLILGFIGLAIWQWLQNEADSESHKATALSDSNRAHGTASWISNEELDASGLKDAKDGLIIGRANDKKRTMLRYPGQAHAMTFAPTGSGKGVSTIIPNLLKYPGSVFCIDPKGENPMVAGRRRRELGQAVFNLDPWGLTRRRCHAFNPLDWLHEENAFLVDDAMMLADALIIQRSERDPFWHTEALSLLNGLILYVACHEPVEKRNLLRVRELLTTDPDDFEELLEEMAKSDQAHGIIARCANRMRQKSDREFSGVVSSAQSNTNFLDSPAMHRVLGHSDFDLADLKSKKMSIFLVLPAMYLEPYSGWLRLMTAMAVTAPARTQNPPDIPVLYLLDEFAALGKLPPIQRAVGLMRGYGVKLWPIVQDLAQLKALYPQSWQTFLANSGVVQAFGVNDTETAQWLAQRLGSYSHWTASFGGQHLNHGVVQRELMTAEELMRLNRETQILMVAGERPINAWKLTYYNDKDFKGLFDPNPYITGWPDQAAQPVRAQRRPPATQKRRRAGA